MSQVIMEVPMIYDGTYLRSSHTDDITLVRRQVRLQTYVSKSCPSEIIIYDVRLGFAEVEEDERRHGLCERRVSLTPFASTLFPHG